MKKSHLISLFSLCVIIASCNRYGDTIKQSADLADKLSGEWQVESIVYSGAKGDSSVVADSLGLLGFQVGCEQYDKKTKQNSSCLGYYKTDAGKTKKNLGYRVGYISPEIKDANTPEGTLGSFVLETSEILKQGTSFSAVQGSYYMTRCDGSALEITANYFGDGIKYTKKTIKAKKTQ